MINLLLLPIRYLHALISIFIIAITTLVLFPFLILVVLIDIKKAYVIQWLWAKIFLFICGVRLYVNGKENIPKTGAILLFNHSSFLDIPTMVLISGHFMYYVAKKELGKIPVLGFCFRLVKTLMMPRNDLKASIALYDEAKSRLAKGDQFVIAPEGTRNRSPGIGEFKSGPFIFAMSCKADLVPVVIKGARVLWPPQHLVPNLAKMTSSIYVHIYPKISTESWTEENRKDKMKELRQFFEQKYTEI